MAPFAPCCPGMQGAMNRAPTKSVGLRARIAKILEKSLAILTSNQLAVELRFLHSFSNGKQAVYGTIENAPIALNGRPGITGGSEKDRNHFLPFPHSVSHIILIQFWAAQ